VIGATDHEYGVCCVGDQERVGCGERGRRVDEHDIDLAAEVTEQRLQSFAATEIGRIRGDWTGGDEKERPVRDSASDFVPFHVGRGQEVREATIVANGEDLVQGSPAPIGIDDCY